MITSRRKSFFRSLSSKERKSEVLSSKGSLSSKIFLQKSFLHEESLSAGEKLMTSDFLAYDHRRPFVQATVRYHVNNPPAHRSPGEWA